MKIIDLLNKIANGEAVPKKIKYDGGEFICNNSKDGYYRYDCDLSEFIVLDYDCLNDEVTILETTITYNQNNYYQYQPYTGEVEIKCNSAKNLLESDKIYNQDNRIEKIDIDGYTLSPTGVGKIEFTISEKILANKINEIIDKLNGE